MMERRVKGARKVTRPGAKSENIAVKTRRSRKSSKASSGISMSLDKWLGQGGVEI